MTINIGNTYDPDWFDDALEEMDNLFIQFGTW